MPWKKWFNNKVPAFVEGSDCKSRRCGQSASTKWERNEVIYKIGAFNFDALMYALLDWESRLVTSDVAPKIEKAYLKSIAFTTGKWKRKENFI